MTHRWFLWLTLVLAVPCFGVDRDDVLFFAPYEDSVRAAVAEGEAAPRAAKGLQFAEGVRGRALVVDAGASLIYPLPGNVNIDEGTIMMWVKPQWRPDDGHFHDFFRASTGNHGGKALNAILLYEYIRGSRLFFYSSDGAPTDPSRGRTLARHDDLDWEPGRWVHIAATWSATLANTESVLYINGKPAGAAGGAVYVPDQPPPTFTIGGPADSAATWFDDVLVFARPLLAREVNEIYQSYRSSAGSPPDDLPFAGSRDLQLAPYVHFGRQQVIVVTDCRSARKQLAGRRAAVTVTVARGRELARKTQPLPDSLVARPAFPYPDIGAGAVTVTAQLECGGETIRTGRLDYTVPVKPQWVGNSLGVTDQVLPPWTPVQVSDNALSVWGRSYRVSEGALPAQVRSQGRDLLAAPMSLALRIAGRDTTLRLTPEEPRTATGAATRRWRGETGPIQCEVDTRIESDGFYRVDMTWTPRGAVRLERLQLTIPLVPAQTTLYHHANATWTELSDAGAIGPVVGWVKSLPFVPYVWLGDERTGLAWCADDDWGWQPAAEQRVLEIAHTEDAVELRVHVVDEPTSLTKPLRLTFGLLATPVRPLPEDWRGWRQGFISVADVETYVEKSDPPPGGRRIAVLWWNHAGAFSYPPRDPERMRRAVDLLRGDGWDTVVSYFALDYSQVGTPEYRLMEREWRRNPYSESAAAGALKITYGSLCNASSWGDFLLYAIDKTMDETGTDGVYLDCSNPNFCLNPEHGCAPGRYPLLETRVLQKRIYALVKRKRGARGFVYNHNSENNILTTFAFSDAVLNGEQFNRKDLRTLSLEKFRAEFLPYSSGLPNILLPTLTKFQPNRQEKMPGSQFLTFPLLHDVICVQSWMAPETQRLLLRIQKLLHDFGAERARFLPYWDADSPVRVQPATPVSAYLLAEPYSLLLIARGAPDGGQVTVDLGGPLASLRGRAARDLLRDSVLSWRGNRLVWPLPARELGIARIGSR